jgi:hypothetical protein
MYIRSFAGIVVDRSRPSPKAVTKVKETDNYTTSPQRSPSKREEYCVIYKFVFFMQN